MSLKAITTFFESVRNNPRNEFMKELASNQSAVSLVDMTQQLVDDFDEEKFERDCDRLKAIKDLQLCTTTAMMQIKDALQREGIAGKFNDPTDVSVDIAQKLTAIIKSDSPLISPAVLTMASNLYEQCYSRYASDGIGSIRKVDVAAARVSDDLRLSIAASPNCPGNICRGFLQANEYDLLLKHRDEFMSERKVGLDRAYIGANMDFQSERVTDDNYKACLKSRIRLIDTMIRSGHLEDIQQMYCGHGVQCLVSDMQEYIDYAEERGILAVGELDMDEEFTSLQESLLQVSDDYSKEGYCLRASEKASVSDISEMPEAKHHKGQDVVCDDASGNVLTVAPSFDMIGK